MSKITVFIIVVPSRYCLTPSSRWHHSVGFK